MQTRKFHLGDILSITTGRLMSPEGIGGVYKILNYMTRDNLYTHQLGRAIDDCRPWLLRQLPLLDSPAFQVALGELLCCLETEAGEAEPEMLVKGWLCNQIAIYGEMLPVSPILQDDHDRIDPIDEAATMFGEDRVIVVEAPED